MRTGGFMRYALFALAHIGFVIAATIAMYIYAIEAWMAPFSPALYFCLFELLVLAVYGGYWFVSTKHQIDVGIGADGLSAEKLGFQRLTEVAGQAVLSFMAAIVLLTWAVPQVRSLIIDTPKSNRVQLHAALSDPDPRVLDAACRRLMSIGLGASRHTLFDALADQPRVASSCLTASKELQGAQAMARRVAARRINELQAANAYTAKSRCDGLDVAVALSESFYEPTSGALFECAIRAETDEARICCANQMHERDYLREASTRVPSFYPELIASTFTPTSLDGSKEINERIKLRDRGDDILAFGCDHIAADNLRPAFEILTEVPGCGLNKPQKEALVAPFDTDHFCQFVASDPSPSENICLGLHRLTFERAVDAAHDTISVSAAAFLRDRDAMFVDRGVREAASFGTSREPSKEESNFLALSSRVGLGARSWLDGPCLRNVMDTDNMRFQIRIADCETYDVNKTVGEVVDDVAKRRRETLRLIQNPNSRESRKIRKRRENDPMSIRVRRMMADIENRTRKK